MRLVLPCPSLCLSGDPRGFGYVYDQRAFEGEDAVIIDRVPARHDVMGMYGAYFRQLARPGESRSGATGVRHSMWLCTWGADSTGHIRMRRRR